jgi:signal transduction histidine kinase
LELVVDLDPRLLSVSKFNGDAVHLRQVLLNLCTSAIKFTHRGSVKIIVTAAQILDRNAVFVKLNVVDTGCGISGNKLEEIVRMLADKDSTKLLVKRWVFRFLLLFCISALILVLNILQWHCARAVIFIIFCATHGW